MSPVCWRLSHAQGWRTAPSGRELLIGAALATVGLALIGAGMPALTPPPVDTAAAAARSRGHGQAASPVAAPEPRGLAETALPWRAGRGLAGEEAGRLPEWVAGEGGVAAATAYPGWDLRVVITEMANSQRGFWARPCLCAKSLIGKGPR